MKELLRSLRRLPARAWIGAGLVVMFVPIALLAPALAPHPKELTGSPYQPPSFDHVFGLNDIGQDVGALLIWGTRVSLTVGICAALVAVTIGTTIGTVAAYAGGGVELTLMAITDFLLVIPRIPFMVVVAVVAGGSTQNVILVIGLLSWPPVARLVRARVKTLRSLTFVRRAKLVGGSAWYVVTRHIVPHLASIVTATVVLTVAEAVFLETALAFLGLSDPTTVSWGSMIQAGFDRGAASVGAWWAFVPPGLCVAALVLGCTLFRTALDEKINPRLAVSNLGVVTRRRRKEPADA